MCIEIVHNQSYPVDVFIPLCKLLDEAGKVIARAPLGDFGEVATRLWLDRAKHIARALAFVFVVHFPALPWRHSRRWADVIEELNRLLIQADQWTLLIDLTGVNIKNVFHALDKLLVDPGHAPTLLLPRLQVVLLQNHPDAFVADRINYALFHHVVFDQFQGPAIKAFGWIAAHRGHHITFKTSIQTHGTSGAGVVMQRFCQAARFVILFNIVNGPRSNLQKVRHFGDRETLVTQVQSIGSINLPGIFSGFDEFQNALPVGLSENNDHCEYSDKKYKSKMQNILSFF